MKRGQVVLEYLMTYGWGVLVVIIGISVLVYFGFLSPTSLLPNSCDFGAQLICEEFKVVKTGTGADVKVRLRNDFGRDIKIFDVYGIDMTLNQEAPQPLLIAKREVEELYITTINPVSRNEKAKVSMVLEFARNDTGAPRHNLTGEVFVLVQ